MLKYSTLFVPCVNGLGTNLDDGIKDENELHIVIESQTEDGSKLHSIIPKVHEGSTTGYMLIFEDGSDPEE